MRQTLQDSLRALDSQTRRLLPLLSPFQGFLRRELLTAMCGHREMPRGFVLTSPQTAEFLERVCAAGLLDKASDVTQDEPLTMSFDEEPLIQSDLEDEGENDINTLSDKANQLDAAWFESLSESLAGRTAYRTHPALPFLARQGSDSGDVAKIQAVYSRCYADYSMEAALDFEMKSFQVMNNLRREEQNLCFALASSCNRHVWREVADLLEGMACLFSVSGRWSEWKSHIDCIQAAIKASKPRLFAKRNELEVILLWHCHTLAEQDGDMDTQKRCLDQMMNEVDSMGDARLRALFQYRLGVAAQAAGQWKEAAKQFAAAKKTSLSTIDAEYERMIILYREGILLQEQADKGVSLLEQEEEIGGRSGKELRQRAADCFQQALDIADRRKVPQAYACILLCQSEGMNFKDAEDICRKCLSHARFINDSSTLASVWHQWGNLHQKRGQDALREGRQFESLQDVEQAENRFRSAQESFLKAQTFYGNSLGLSRSLGDNRRSSVTLLNLGKLAQDRYERSRNAYWLEEAERFFQECLKLSEKDRMQQARVYGQMGLLWYEWGDWEQALTQYQKCHDLAEQVKYPNLQAWALIGAAQVHWRQGNPDFFLRLNEALQLYEDIGNQEEAEGMRQLRDSLAPAS